MIAAIAAAGGYESKVFGAGVDEFRRVLSATFLSIALTGVGCYLLQFPLSRGFFVLVGVIGMVLVLGGRALLRSSVMSARRNGSLQHRVLVVGGPTHVDDIAAVLDRERWLGYDVVGALTPGLGAETPGGVPVLGNRSLLALIARDVGADVVFFAGGGVESAAEMR